MSDPNETEDGPGVRPGPTDDIDDTPVISCSRCGREWDLAYELDDLGVGNQAVEQFALDHMQHTGHFPDDVGTWRADCLQCPDGAERLSEHAVRRWGETHARHTRHRVRILPATGDEPSVVEW